MKPGRGNCHLCNEIRQLRRSHIIPAWAYRDEICGPDGKMIDLTELSVHSRQLRLPMLCDECEGKFSKWENPARGAALESAIGGKYGDWLFPFATSISWRVLKFQQMRPESEMSDNLRSILARPSVNNALSSWSNCLLHDRLDRSKSHRQHLFCVSKDYDRRQAICVTLGKADGHVFTYARFSFYCILGMIETSDRKAIEKNHIKVHGGEFSGKQYLPLELAKYLVSVEDEALARVLMFAAKQVESQ